MGFRTRTWSLVLAERWWVQASNYAVGVRMGSVYAVWRRPMLSRRDDPRVKHWDIGPYRLTVKWGMA
jgi:hypothetical protein